MKCKGCVYHGACYQEQENTGADCHIKAAPLRMAQRSVRFDPKKPQAFQKDYAYVTQTYIRKAKLASSYWAPKVKCYGAVP